MSGDPLQVWALTTARQAEDSDGDPVPGVWELGSLDGDGNFYPVVVIDTGNYDRPEAAEPLARAILERVGPVALPALPEPDIAPTDDCFGFTADQMNAHATAAILSDRAGRGGAAGWPPIESAPRDGTHILACNAARPYDDHTTFNQNPPHVVHWFNDGFYLSSTGLNEQIKPYEYTHWKPLGAEPCDTKRLEAEAARYPKAAAQLVCDHCGADRLKQPCGQPYRTDGCRFTGEAP